jgi:hypothetical protein
MAWSALTLVTDADLGSFDPQAINGKWGATTWPNQRAQAKIELKTWIETDYRARFGDNVADKIRDTYSADKVWGYTAAAYSDVSGAAGDNTEDDVTLSSVFATFGTDKLYIGGVGSFDGIDVQMLSALNAIASVMTVKYSGPAGWTTLTFTDGTSNSGKTFGKSGRITWTQPSDWQRRTLDNSADAYYWIELSISAALTAGTKAGQILIVRPPDGLKRVCLNLALGYIVLNLASQAPSTDYWLFKARNQFKTGYLDIAESKYAEMRDKGGIPIDIDDDGTIDEEENTITSPLRIGRA